MDRIEWSDEFNIGIGLFDQQHKQLLDLVNGLSDFDEDRDDMADVAEIITELLQLARAHFDYEEKLLLQYNYPDTRAHKKLHTDFINKTIGLTDAANLRVTKVPEWLLLHVRQWFAHHIGEEDMKLKVFLEESGMK